MHQLEEEQDSSLDFTLYDRYAQGLLAYIRRQVSSMQDAEDLLVEVFLAALQRNRLADLADPQQLAWLRRVAHNKIVDRYRRTLPLIIVPLDQTDEETATSEPDPEQLILDQEQYMRLYQALEQLSPLQQQIVRMRYGNGLRLANIAETLHKPVTTISTQLHRALRRLRAIYASKEK